MSEDLNTPSSAIPASAPLREYQERSRRSVREHYDEYRRVLTAHQIRRVTVEYDGVDDSGSIEAMHFFGLESVEVTPPFEEPTISAFEGFFYDLLETRYAGWENNDGAYGSFEWDVENDLLTHEHNERYTATESYSHEGLDDLADGSARGRLP